MRLRLLAAVRALLADPSVAGLKDAARLSAVVLYAKSRAPEGREDDLQSYIWGAELGRWLGMTESTVHHDVLPALRKTGALHTRTVTDDEGHPVGLDCLVMPLWRAHHGGGAAHPLALSKAELAVLLRLLEALFGPGWEPEGKEPTPPGLLAGRTAKGAATDRLGLLLMVLNTRASGWLQLCGGSVRKREGRGAATLARLLGCSPSGARKVLARLTEAGVVARERKATGTRMNGRGRVMLLPVAQAYGRVRLASVQTDQGSGALFLDRPDGACGDLVSAGNAGGLEASGISGGEVVSEAEIQARPDGAEFHTDHASVVTPISSPQLSGGFSGEARGGFGDRPERACVREDQVANGGTATAECVSPAAAVDPLRGEQPKESPVDEREGQRAAEARAGVRPQAVGGGKAQQRRVGLPKDLDLRVVLSPVAGLWERLNGWQQQRVERAAMAEVKRLAGLLVRPETAPRLLADRLIDRLEETGGEALVNSPFAWLTHRGLVQRPACPDLRCDDGIRLDTGADCPTCGNIIHIRRTVRTRVRARVEAELPYSDPASRRAEAERRLREETVLEEQRAQFRRARAAREVEQRQQAIVRRRVLEEDAELARRLAPCADCGLPESAGLCPTCSYQRRTEGLLREAVDLAVAVRADLSDAAAVAELTQQCETDTRALLTSACERACGPDADPALAAFTTPQVAQQIRDERRAAALRRLVRSQEAMAEADAVYEACLRRHDHGAEENAEQAADAAGSRTAEVLLRQLLGELHSVRQRATVVVAAV